MKHATQVALIREIFRAMDRGVPPLADHIACNDVSVYTSAGRDAREREVLFRRHPLVVGFSSQVRAPGDFLTEDLTPVPVLVVRNAAGDLRAFVNICRHRGARVVEGCGSGAVRFICPYHAWSYDTDGRLVTIPDDFGFEGLDRGRHGLIPLPVEEQHGLVWVSPEPRGSVRVGELLGGLGDDLEAYGIASFVHQETRVLRRRMNWKLVSDTFWEAYHLHVLHRKNVGPLFVRNLALFEAFGRCHRLIGVHRSIERLRALPEREWSLVPHATILMNLFPNTVLVMQSDHAEVYRIFPAPDGANESLTAVSLLVPEPGPRWARTMELLIGVVEQDLALGEGIQRSFESGAIAQVTYGRFEPALEHFHRTIREALAAAPGGDARPA